MFGSSATMSLGSRALLGELVSLVPSTSYEGLCCTAHYCSETGPHCRQEEGRRGFGGKRGVPGGGRSLRESEQS